MWQIILLILTPFILLYAGIPVLLGGIFFGGMYMLFTSPKKSAKTLGRIIVILLLLSAIVFNFIVVYGHQFMPYLRHLR